MKKYITWFRLYCKRLLKRPSFLILLIFLPLCTIALTQISKTSDSSIQVGIFIDTKQADTLAMKTLERIKDYDGVIRFHIYNTKEDFIHEVKIGTVDCGYLFPDNLEDALQSGGSEGQIQVLSKPDSASTKLITETIYGIVIQDYSFTILNDYVTDDKVFKEMDAASVTDELKDFYQLYRSNGKTFSFEFRYGTDGNSENVVESSDSPDKSQLSYLMLPIRGMLAVFMLVAGFSGGLMWYTDKQNGIFQQVQGKLSTYLQYMIIWIPTFITGILSIVCIYLCGLGTHPLHEIFSMILYSFAVTAFCSLVRCLIQSQIVYACALPVFAMISLIACPVFTDFSLYIPALKILRAILVPYYYLNAPGTMEQLLSLAIVSIIFSVLVWIVPRSIRLVQRQIQHRICKNCNLLLPK